MLVDSRRAMQMMACSVAGPLLSPPSEPSGQAMTPIEPAMSQKSALKIYRDLRFGCSFDFCMPYELCMSENATLLLNLTPDNTGRLPDEQVATMHRVAELIRNPKSNAD